MLKPAGSSSFGWDDALHVSSAPEDSRLIDLTSSRAKCSTRPQRSIPTSCASILCNLPLTTIPFRRTNVSAEALTHKRAIVITPTARYEHAQLDSNDAGSIRPGPEGEGFSENKICFIVKKKKAVQPF